jgi:hypothetical protein
MHKINLQSSNIDRAIIMTLLIIAFAFVTVIIPFLLVNYFPRSLVGNYFLINVNFIIFTIPIFCYFIYTGVYIYKIKIDPYVINITSYRTITSIFYNDDYIDISHLMLQEYQFFNRPYTINRTLMLKLKTDNGKIVSKRFTFSLLGKKEQNRISKVLNQIIEHNS